VTAKNAGPGTGTSLFRPLYREGASLQLLDQRLLPGQETWLSLDGPEEISRAIREMAVRGAPAIGVAAAYGAAFSLRGGDAGRTPQERFDSARELLAESRPTAVNLFAALARLADRFEALLASGISDSTQLEAGLVAEADAVAAEDIASCLRIGEFGADLLSGGTTVLTHCNAGALATAGYGTALGVIRGAVGQGKAIRVLADETRPFLQGARLTAWELARDGIPVEILTDSMAGHFLSRGEISAVIVGADRIAANGDTARRKMVSPSTSPPLRRPLTRTVPTAPPSRSRSAPPPRSSRSAARPSLPLAFSPGTSPSTSRRRAT